MAEEQARTFRATQGSQPQIADVLVGVMRVGVRGTDAKTQLLVRSPRENRVVVVDRGGSVELVGAGTLRVDEIEGAPGSSKGTVAFTFTPQ